MPSEVLSTARPTPLRLAGFLALAAGAALAGIGATRAWAIVGFPDDLEGAADVTFRGTDVWEGKVVLLMAVAALLSTLMLRLARAPSIRRALCLLLVAFGIVSVALPVIDAVRATDRFGGGENVDRFAERLAAQLELPTDVVRDQLAELIGDALRVEVGGGIWVAAAGGLLLAAGGLLSLAYVRRGASPRVPNAETV
jgi:hypothetical protein